MPRVIDPATMWDLGQTKKEVVWEKMCSAADLSVNDCTISKVLGADIVKYWHDSSGWPCYTVGLTLKEDDDEVLKWSNYDPKRISSFQSLSELQHITDHAKTKENNAWAVNVRK